MKRNRVVALVVVALLVLSVTAAAAWLVTRTAQTTTLVLGTFTLDGLECAPSVVMEYATCSVPVENQYNLPARITSVISTSPDRQADYSTVANTWLLDGVVGNANSPTILAAGQTGVITFEWRPRDGAAVGSIGIMVAVTAEAD